MQKIEHYIKPLLQFTDLIKTNAVAGKRVFIRADLNVPQDSAGNITEDTRIKASLPCIQQALAAGAAVMLTSHLGRPTEGVYETQYSLAPIAKRLEQLLGQPVNLIKDWFSDFKLEPGQLVLLENCRFLVGEKKNAPQLAQQMASLTDIYVNDAFGTAHRAQATTHGIAKYAKQACVGPLLYQELTSICQALSKPKLPLVAIVGGSKVSTKLTVLNNLAEKVDNLIVGGGIANTFILAQGQSIGKSLAEPDLVAEAKAIITKLQARGVAIPLPTDVVVATEFTQNASATPKALTDIQADEMILDVGPQTAQKLAQIVATAGTIVWNGPVGVFEIEQFSHGTQVLAQAIAASGAFSIAGGGDTLAAVAKYGLAKQINYISTGGGAFLEMLEGKILPAIEILYARATQRTTN